MYGFNRIWIEALYFLPRGVAPRPNWFLLLHRALSRCALFHWRSLRESMLLWRVQARPWMGKHGFSYYEDKPLARVQEELHVPLQRSFSILCVFAEIADPSDADGGGTCAIFKGDYGIVLIAQPILELLARRKEEALSVIYHELGHAMGLEHPDPYDASVMGLGCWAGLKRTYINEHDRAYLLSSARWARAKWEQRTCYSERGDS